MLGNNIYWKTASWNLCSTWIIHSRCGNFIFYQTSETFKSEDIRSFSTQIKRMLNKQGRYDPRENSVAYYISPGSRGALHNWVIYFFKEVCIWLADVCDNPDCFTDKTCLPHDCQWCKQHIEVQAKWSPFDDIYKYIFQSENVLILSKISLTFFFQFIYKISVMGQIMAWCWTGEWLLF